jgi:uncharacterized protein
MLVQHREEGTKGAFYVEENGKVLAEMTYVWAGEAKFIIDHTEVDKALAGQSAGKQLVAQAVAFARERGVKILPLCPFAKSVIMKTEAYHDIL